MKLRNLITIMLFLGMISINLQRTNVFVLASEMTTLKIKSRLCSQSDKDRHGCQILAGNETKHSPLSGPYICTSREQCYIIDAFLIGYLISQIPTGIFARRIGFKLLIGIGMLLNTISGFLIPVLSLYGNAFVIILRFLQGMGEATFIPCAHWILTNWTPPNERGRRVAIVYSGIPIGIALALSSSFVVTRNEILGGWPSLFYYCSTIGILWLIGFSILVTDDPDDHNKISSRERHDIKAKLWGRRKPQEADIPWGSILKSAPFRAVLIGYIGYYYGFVVMVIEFPKFMHETMNYDINKHGYLAALPFGIMGIFAIMMGVMLDDLITQLQLSGSTARKIAQAIGQFGPAICIGAVAFSDCNLYIVLSLLTAGIGLNGSAYAGVITNLIDISPCFAGLTIAFTNFIAQGVAYTAIVIVDAILHINPSIFGWQVFFMSCSAVYVLCTIIFLIYASSKVQPWDRDFTIFSSSTYNPAQSL
ncbi:hypothetical protein O3M35_009976 [Rhynocoris fuscipes]|uniref:Major facilitator superfamily (MFS) profile domain-containing protein n=1 Tax=Rhynocoris fuscipes TaxID=488301 RepID=A0AAW1CX91_9HEMI